MELILTGHTYVCRTTYDERAVPKAAGFRWNPSQKVWSTTDIKIAAKLSAYANTETKAVLASADENRKEAYASSSATTSDIELPAPDGLEYLPYQRAGIAYALGKDAVLIGDEMGLGKTIQALGVINSTPKAKNILIIVPASLRLNWQREAEKWLVNKDLTIGIAKGSNYPNTDIVIINYDILTKHSVALRERNWDVLIADEAHYLKNPKAQRTKQVFGDWRYKTKEWKTNPLKAKRRILLTGTPIVNRPIELWGLANYLAPAEFNNFMSYANRYANAQHNGWGWDFTGAANLDELQEKLRTRFLVRRLKADVLTDLPAKRRQIIELPSNGASKAIEAEQKSWTSHEEQLAMLRTAVEQAKVSDDPTIYDEAVAALREGTTIAFADMARTRHETALAKVSYVSDHIADAIDNGGKVIVFAHHLDVIASLKDDISDRGIGVVSLTGSDSMEDRQDAVDAFQNDDEIKVFIGNIRAAGVGITLTASSHVIFAELDWVPASLSQAEDRAHRIGQTDSVLVQHLVLEGSLDQLIAKQLIAKQAIIDRALDDEIDIEADAKLPTIPTTEDTVSITRKEVATAVTTPLDATMVKAIHQGLKTLHALCDGAQAVDGMGYSKFDARFGGELAQLPALTPKQAVYGQKLVYKYRRQLNKHLLEAAGAIK